MGLHTDVESEGSRNDVLTAGQIRNYGHLKRFTTQDSKCFPKNSRPDCVYSTRLIRSAFVGAFVVHIVSAIPQVSKQRADLEYDA